jgi:hypothetical protein
MLLLREVSSSLGGVSGSDPWCDKIERRSRRLISLLLLLLWSRRLMVLLLMPHLLLGRTRRRNVGPRHTRGDHVRRRLCKWTGGNDCVGALGGLGAIDCMRVRGCLL